MLNGLVDAARDGSVEIVQHLLHHGARPDYRDKTNRTAIQHGMDFPQVLWLLEGALRRHRFSELVVRGSSLIVYD